jgi:hypothetical protein
MNRIGTLIADREFKKKIGRISGMQKSRKQSSGHHVKTGVGLGGELGLAELELKRKGADQCTDQFDQ